MIETKFNPQKIVDALEQNIFAKDLNSKYIFANEHYAQLISQTTSSIIGKDDNDFFPPQIAKKYQDDDKKVITSKEIIEVEETIFVKNEKRIIKTIKKPLFENGEVIGVLGIFWDITKEKEDETRYKELQHGLLQAQALSNIGHWELNLKTNKLYWSDEVFRIFGSEPQSFGATYEAFLSHIHPDDIELVNSSYLNSLNEGRGYHVIHRIIRENGSIGYVEERCEHEFDDKGNALRSIGTVHDITHKKEAEDELALVYEVFAKMSDGVMITDQNKKIIKINDAYTKITGFNYDELYAKIPHCFKEQWHKEDTYKQLNESIAISGQWKGEISQRKKNAEIFHAHVSIIELRDKSDEITNYIIIINDITSRVELLDIIHKHNDQLSLKVEEKTKELKRLNNSLEETVRVEIEKNKKKDALVFNQSKLASMGEMIGNIAHQWHQPLNALGLIIQKIEFYNKNNMLNEEKINAIINKSMGLINTMSHTIDDFRYFFNPNKEKEIFPICNAITKAYSVVEPFLENNQIKFHMHDNCNASINGYQNEFSQVILNIINNAKDILVEREIKYPEIEIWVETEDKKITIKIGDNAGGISATPIEKVFEPYFSTKSDDKGTGIGLYMSKMIVEDSMNGTLNVINGNKGAIFEIIFDLEP